MDPARSHLKIGFPRTTIASSSTELNRPVNMTLSVNRENGELAGLREANDLNRDGSVRLPGAGRFETEKTSKPQVLPNVGDTGGRKNRISTTPIGNAKLPI